MKIPPYEAWYDALEAKQGFSLQRRLVAATVAICGCGGLGSNIAVDLARAGVGKLILIDKDDVELSNLHRQQFKVSQIGKAKVTALKDNLAEIAPYVEVACHRATVDAANALTLIDGADIVCEAFDDATAKATLADIVLTKTKDTCLVAAAGMAGLGSANDIVTRRINDRFYLCGDGESDVADDLCLVPTRVQLCAAHQAHAVLTILAEKEIDDEK